jgi:DNA-binding NtrC family response regulator
VPALRDRLEDLPLLIEDTLTRLQAQLGRRIAGVTPRFLARLRRHAWSGNVRELQHVLAHAALLEDGILLEGHDFTPQASNSSTVSKPSNIVQALHSASPSNHPHANSESQTFPILSTPITGSESRRSAAERALAHHGGNKSRAATALGITRKTFYAWLEATGENSERL